MKHWLLVLIALTIVACGGGGGGGSVAKINASGRVLNVESGGPTNPASSVQVPGASVLTSVADGSFTLGVASGTSSITVDTLSAFGVWSFAVPPITATTDIGDLWVGPERITVRGTVRNATNNNPIGSARVVFAGRAATSGADGRFELTQVAFSTPNPAGFYGIVGNSTAAGFFLSNFTAGSAVPTAGVMVLDDILMTPASDPTPPPPPYSVWGRVSPTGTATGTIVTLKSGATPIRIFNVGADGFYYFWVGPGTYTIEYVKGSLTAPTQNVTVDSESDIERRDVTLG